MKRFIVLPLLLITALLFAACAPVAAPAAAPAAEAPAEAPAADIVDTAVAAGSFTTLVAAVEAAGLVDALKAEGPFTVFAPSDEAFAAIDPATIDALLADPSGDLTQILLYHVVPGRVLAADVTDGLVAETLQGGSLTFAVNDAGVTVNGVNVVSTDIAASNGVIHVIDGVLMPPAEEAAVEEPMAEEPAMADIVDTAVAAGSFNTLVAAVEAAGLVDALKAEGPFTVFAPTDDAFAAIDPATIEALLADPSGDLTQILTYHVVPGKVMAADVTDGLVAETLQGGSLTFAVSDAGVTVNGVNVVSTDIETSNGVIHVIDGVLLPPAEEAAAEEPMAEAPAADIVDTAVGAGNFTTLVAAVQAAGLVDALKGEGPFTVFAPSDEAFAAIDPATIEALLADPSGDLTQILLYHVVPGKVMAADVTDGLVAETLQGGSLTFHVADSGVSVNDVHIVSTDILASNGVIHVINGVLMPPAE